MPLSVYDTNPFFAVIYVIGLILSTVFTQGSFVYYTEYIHVAWLIARPWEVELIVVFLYAALLVNWVSVQTDTRRWVDYLIAIIMAIHFFVDFTMCLELLKKYLKRTLDTNISINKLLTWNAQRVMLFVLLDILGGEVEYLIVPVAVLTVTDFPNPWLGLYEIALLITGLVFRFLNQQYIEAMIIFLLVILTLFVFSAKRAGQFEEAKLVKATRTKSARAGRVRRGA